jgi:hypothetical protein
MKRFFLKNNVKHIAVNPKPDLKYKNSRVVESITDLLKRQELKLNDIRTSLSVNDEIFKKLYLRLFESMANLAQCVPASEQDHHSNLYGFTDHVFECVVLALRYREGFVYRSDREDMIMKKKDVFSYAVTVGALCHDLGKLVTDIQFHNLTTNKPHSILFGPMTESTEFIYRFYPERKIQDHKTAGLIALNHVVPTEGLRWIQEEETLFRELLHAIAGEHTLSGKLGEIILKADRYSTSQNLRKIADKYSHQNNAVARNYNDMSIDTVQQTIATDSRNSRAVEIADALMSSLNRHEELANGKKINEKGGFVWVTKKYIYVVTPRCFNVIQAALESKHSKIKVSQAHICYQILGDAGFIEKVNGKLYDYFVIDSDGWGKSLPLVRFIRTKLDPALKLTEANFLIENETEKKKEKDTTSEKEEPTIITNEQPNNINAIDGQGENSTAPENQPNNINAIISQGENTTVFEKQSPTSVNEMTSMFLKWLHKSLKIKTLDVNKNKSPIHFVSQGMCLVSPVIFELFLKSQDGIKACEQSNIDNTQLTTNKLIKSIQHVVFESGIHFKDIDRKNILHFSVEGANKKNSTIAGMLIRPDVFPHIFEGTFSKSRNVFLISVVAL